MSMSRSFTASAAVMTLALGGLAVPQAAAAGPASLVIVPLCALFQGGTTTVEAGPVEVWQGGWAVGTKGALVHWLKSQRTTLTVLGDDAPVVRDMTSAWSAPWKLPDETVWVSDQPVVPLGDLEAGESVTVTTRTVWSKPTLEFFFYAREGERPVLSKGGTQTATCVITAE